MAKLSDSEAEAVETQVWLQFSVECKYMDRETTRELYTEYDNNIGKLVNMINHPNDWKL